MTLVADLLRDGRLPRLETRMLLEHVLQKPRAWLLAHDTDPMPEAAARAYHVLVERRLAGEPMAYLLGEREFMGHVFGVTPDVLIPRPDTEVLVDTGIAFVSQHETATVVDLGTGSGAIAVSIALACPNVEVHATDRSEAALSVARANAQRLSARVRFFQGDWYAALPADQRYDLIVSNPPYIAANDTHLGQGDLRHEPRGALTDEADGLSALAAIVAGASSWLRPGGAIWLEHGWDQAEAVRDLLRQAKFQQVESRRDLAGIERISGGYL